MIYRLQRKFILICTVSVLTVIALVFGVILVLNISSMNRNMDMLADRVSMFLFIEEILSTRITPNTKAITVSTDTVHIRINLF